MVNMLDLKIWAFVCVFFAGSMYRFGMIKKYIQMPRKEQLMYVGLYFILMQYCVNLLKDQVEGWEDRMGSLSEILNALS